MGTTTDDLGYGTRVRSVSKGPLGVLDPDDSRRFLSDVFVNPGDVGSVVAAAEQLPDGWLLVDFDGTGVAPIHPSMVEPIGRRRQT